MIRNPLGNFSNVVSKTEKPTPKKSAFLCCTGGTGFSSLRHYYIKNKKPP